MFRRRRPQRSIPFSFDSFLDVVANVVGIIMRLILVAWVSGRAYHAGLSNSKLDVVPAKQPAKVAVVQAEPTTVADPLEIEVAQHRLELQEEQDRLHEQENWCHYWESVKARSSEEKAMLVMAEQVLQQHRDQLDHSAEEQTAASQGVHVSVADLEERQRRVAEELLALQKLPPLTKTLHYHTPISRPVHSEELHFECRQGRVSFIDIQSFLIEVRNHLDEHGQQLRTQWSVEGVTGPIGAFRLRYTVERDKGLLDGATPSGEGNFRYGMTGWLAEPTAAVRGETAPLAANAEFRRLTQSLDPEHTVVTFWVYPDSFALYRQLRDYLHERNIEVAGRPLPEGVGIASTRHGAASRGQ
jgi:hypothetical protein